MKLLAIDTSTEACSVAVLDEESVYSRFEVCPQKHSQRLLPMLQEVLDEAGLALADLDALAFGRGPGSFTGVRIATGMIQGLALGTGLPVAGISTMAAMAQQAHMQSGVQKLAVAIDARMQEVYFAQYEIKAGLAELLGEEAVMPPALAQQQLKGSTELAVGTGWQAYEALSSVATFQISETLLYPSAEFILPLAKRAYTEKNLVSVEAIEPVYLRDKVTWKKLPGRE